MTTGFVALHLLLIFLLVRQIYLKLPSTSLKRYFVPALITKLSAGILYGFVFQYHYGFGDTLNFFSDGLLLSDLAKTSPIAYIKGFFTNQFPDAIEQALLFAQQPRALFLAKIASFILLLCDGNYWICAIYFSLFSFLGLFYLAHTCAQQWPSKTKQAAIAFLFFPSVAFWSAGLNKESIVVGCMGFLMDIFIKYYFRNIRVKWHHLLIILLGAYIIWTLKYYYAALLFPVMASLILIRYTITHFKRKNTGWLQVGLWLLSFGLLLLAGSYLHPILHFDRFFQNLFDQHNAIVALSSEKGIIHFHSLEPNAESFVRNIPLALFSGLFRPGLWDAGNLFQWFTALENLILLIFAIGALWNIRKISWTKAQWLLWGAVIYIIILATILAFAAPNFGTLARYKIGFLPLLVFIILFDNPLFLKMRSEKEET